MKSVTWVEPSEWPKPKGYQNGALVQGKTLYIAGQVGWNSRGEFESDELLPQFAQALDNVLTVVRAAGGEPSDVVKMTVYVTDLPAYRSSLREMGALWRPRFGKHFPVMALVGVTGLVELRAKVEIEAVAILEQP